ncbi:MAG: cation diffusion facilitator family transporter [Candidatus Nanopelagicales bacterium]
MSTEGGMKAVLAALAANLGIAVAKFVAFLLTQSSSMLAEAIHSLADSGNQVLLLVGNKRSKQTRTATHQFGYGRRRYIYGFIVAIVLFLVGGLFSLYEGIHKVQHPEPLNDAGIAFAVLLIAIVLEAFSLRTAVRESNRARGKRSLPRFIRDTRNPELPVILLEDTGALLGLVFALIGITLAVVTGNGAFDGIGAMAVGTLLVVIAIFLAMEMTSMLTGESALPEEDAAITAAIEATPGVERMIHQRTLHVGPDEILVAAKIAVPAASSAAEVAGVIDAAEVAIRAQIPDKECVIYLEPDIYDADHPDPATETSGHGDTTDPP